MIVAACYMPAAYSQLYNRFMFESFYREPRWSFAESRPIKAFFRRCAGSVLALCVSPGTFHARRTAQAGKRVLDARRDGTCL